MLKTHKDLLAWQKSMDLVEAVYSLSKNFPPSERQGLTDQLRRCAVSVPSNLAEGAARNSKKDFARFLHISLGSLSEMETQLLIAQRLKYIDTIPLQELTEVKRMILGLVRSIGE